MYYYTGIYVPDELLLVKELGSHLRDLLILLDELDVLLLALLLQRGNPLLTFKINFIKYNLNRRQKFLLHAIHSPFYWQILKCPSLRYSSLSFFLYKIKACMGR